MSEKCNIIHVDAEGGSVAAPPVRLPWSRVSVLVAARARGNLFPFLATSWFHINPTG